MDFVDPVDQQDEIDRRFIEFLRSAPRDEKSRLLKSLHEWRDFSPKKSPRSTTGTGLSYSGAVYRVCYESGPPSISAWRDLLFECSERLRDGFEQERLDRVMFTANPDSEGEYRVEAELLYQRVPSVSKSRTRLRFRRPVAKSAKTTSALDDFLQDADRLDDSERRVLSEFGELDTERRLKFWQSHLSKFYR